MTRILLAMLMLGALAPAALADQAQSGPTTAGAEPRPLRIERDPGRVILQAVVRAPDYPLEFLLASGTEKAYETLLTTPARPSDVHAALLALGLDPGKPARWSREPDEGGFLPPQGAEIDILVRWTDSQGRRRQCNVSDWIKAQEDDSRDVDPPRRWVFIGSIVMPDGTYVADLPAETGIVSTANIATSVIDVPFESASDVAGRLFMADLEKVPASGTPVEVVLQPVEGAAASPHARAVLDIDPQGRVSLMGKPMDKAELMEWAGQYARRHSKAQVMLRPAGRTMVYDVLRVESQLRLRGLRDFDYWFLPPRGVVLPRTEQELEQARDDWQRRLAEPEEYIEDPAAQVRDVIRQIEAELEQIERRKALLEGYQAWLGEVLEEYEGSGRAKRREGMFGQSQPGEPEE